MTQTVGLFPELSDNERKRLKMQLAPTSGEPTSTAGGGAGKMPRLPGGKVPGKKPRRKTKRYEVDTNPPYNDGAPGGVNAPNPLQDVRTAVSSRFSMPKPFVGGTTERRNAARRKAGK